MATGSGVAFLNGFGAGLGGACSTGSGNGLGASEGGATAEETVGTGVGKLVLEFGSGGLEDGKGIDENEVADGAAEGIFITICFAW